VHNVNKTRPINLPEAFAYCRSNDLPARFQPAMPWLLASGFSETARSAERRVSTQIYGPGNWTSGPFK
jgi:hypothetical protein